jgi:rhodanese-related sulfurtransferase
MYLLALLFVMASWATAPAPSVALAALKPLISAKHPSVPWIDDRALNRALTETGSPVLLLDTRSRDEWRVSHLRQAMHLPADTEDLRVLPKDKRQRIVVYCAVGYRSAALAERLLAAGYTDVRNLEGGIFAWANAGHPLVRGDQPTVTVHPYDAIWGAMLRTKHRASVPAIP